MRNLMDQYVIVCEHILHDVYGCISKISKSSGREFDLNGYIGLIRIPAIYINGEISLCKSGGSVLESNKKKHNLVPGPCLIE